MLKISTTQVVTTENNTPFLVKKRFAKLDRKIANSPLWTRINAFSSFGEAVRAVYELNDGSMTYYASATIRSSTNGGYDFEYHHPRIAFHNA